MGFWHTGYMEFHEPTGLGELLVLASSPECHCALCGAIFSSADELRTHRFETHPLRLPTLTVDGRELGRRSFVITAPVTEADVVATACERALLNNEVVPLSNLPKVIAALPNGTFRLTLAGAEVTAEFALEVRIASDTDLLGIEREFDRIALGGCLDARAIDAFIAATVAFESAIGYCDGICAYLYGVLAKERSNQSSLAHEKYVGKYSKAAEQLAGYDRALARTICSLIEFHFNHFREVAHLAGRARAGRVAANYLSWQGGAAADSQFNRSPPSTVAAALEERVSDWDTEQILRWASTDLVSLTQVAPDMETFLSRAISDLDRVKVQVLLAEVYARAGDTPAALKHAKSLRNLVAFEAWAESRIRTYGGMN